MLGEAMEEAGLAERACEKSDQIEADERERVGERGGEGETGIGRRRRFFCTLRLSCSRTAS
jgi:hypothetical protein